MSTSRLRVKFYFLLIIEFFGRNSKKRERERDKPTENNFFTLTFFHLLLRRQGDEGRGLECTHNIMHIKDISNPDVGCSERKANLIIDSNFCASLIRIYELRGIQTHYFCVLVKLLDCKTQVCVRAQSCGYYCTLLLYRLAGEEGHSS